MNAQAGDVILVKLYEETRPGNDVEPFNVAKVRVVNASPEALRLDWAYQIQPNSRELKPRAAGERSPSPGAGRGSEPPRREREAAVYARAMDGATRGARTPDTDTKR